MKISVVTPSFNQLGFLRETMASVLSQEGEVHRGDAEDAERGGEKLEVEWIVVDGGSTDGTVEWLRSVADPRVRRVSEGDRGQGHAINKGLGMACGDVVAWLNSDDVYAPGALAAVAGEFSRNPAARWVVGRCEIIDEAGRVIRAGVTRYKERGLRGYSYRKLLRENFISQPAVFWRRGFGEEVGPLDESLHYTMDYDLWLRMGRAADPVVLDRVLARFRMHGGSKSGQVKREQFDEEYRVAARYFGGDRLSQAVHRFNVEKIVWAYRVMRLLGL